MRCGHVHILFIFSSYFFIYSVILISYLFQIFWKWPFLACGCPMQVTSKEVVVWDQPGGPHATRIGTLPRETHVEILEIMPASSQTVLTHGRIGDPIAGWISVHSGHIRAGAFVVTLHASTNEQGCSKCLCYNMAGDELASLDLDYLQPQSLVELQQHIGKLVGKDAECLKLTSPNGQLIQELDQLSQFF